MPLSKAYSVAAAQFVVHRLDNRAISVREVATLHSTSQIEIHA